MRFRLPLFVLLFLAGSFSLPFVAHAAIPFFGPIIPTASSQCAAGWGMLMTVINRIISFVLTIAVIFIAPITIAYAGFLMVVNPTSAGDMSKAKSIILNTIIGIVIALAAWLIVDAIMVTLTANNGKPFGEAWYAIISSNGAPNCLSGSGLNVKS